MKKANFIILLLLLASFSVMAEGRTVMWENPLTLSFGEHRVTILGVTMTNYSFGIGWKLHLRNDSGRSLKNMIIVGIYIGAAGTPVYSMVYSKKYEMIHEAERFTASNLRAMDYFDEEVLRGTINHVEYYLINAE